MIRLEKRPSPNRRVAAMTPVIAVILTMIAGGAMFGLLGQNPFEAIKVIFWDPLFTEPFASYSRPQLMVKAGPLILIAIGLSIGFKAGIWNIGAEGQYIHGRDIRGRCGSGVLPNGQRIDFPTDGDLRGFGWLAMGNDPGVSQGQVRDQRNPCVADAGLCGREFSRLGIVGGAA